MQNVIIIVLTFVSIGVALVALMQSYQMKRISLLQYLQDKNAFIEGLQSEGSDFFGQMKKQESELLLSNNVYYRDSFPYAIIALFVSGALLLFLGAYLTISTPIGDASSTQYVFSLILIGLGLLLFMAGLFLFLGSFVLLVAIARRTRLGIFLEYKLNQPQWSLRSKEGWIIPLSEDEAMQQRDEETVCIDIRNKSQAKKDPVPGAICLPYWKNKDAEKLRNHITKDAEVTKKIQSAKQLFVLGLGYDRCYEIANYLRKNFENNVYIVGYVNAGKWRENGLPQRSYAVFLPKNQPVRIEVNVEYDSGDEKKQSQ